MGRPFYQASFHNIQPMPAHMALLIASASTQGQGEEYVRTGTYAAPVRRLGRATVSAVTARFDRDRR
jgi:hypothetical protein